MNSPMDFFRRNHVDSPTNENAGENSPKAQPRSKQKCWNSVDHVQEENVERGTDERYVFRFVGSPDVRMVLKVPISEWGARPV